MTDPAPRTGLYIHWPFCARICPYCDFTVARSRDEDETAWTDALVTDIAMMAARFGPRPLVSVYFGGGTPSLITPRNVGRIIAAAHRHLGVRPDAEITLEANPTDAERRRFAEFRSAGINRLSLGVQSFDDAQLAFLRRNHDAAEALLAVDRTASLFPRFTVDLIYALPEESAAAWASRLARAIDLGLSHLSLYQLTIEEGTPFGRAARRRTLRPLDDDRAATLYSVTREITAAHGVPAYEVSNHAAPGEEAVHNALYWDGADWIGVGPGAHGRITTEDGQRVATAPAASVRDWLAAGPVERYREEVLDGEAVAMEAIAGGLRRVAGMRLGGRFGAAVDRRAAELADDGLLILDGARAFVPAPHRLLTDYVVGRLTDVL